MNQQYNLGNIWEQAELAFNYIKEKPNVIEISPYICSHCKSSNLNEDRGEGEIVCIDCGAVKINTLIDDTAEWNFGGDDAMNSKDPSRCGGPVNPLLEKSSMSTIMTKASYSKHGNLQRLHQQTSMDYVERSRYHVFEDINKMATDVGKLQPNVVEEAKGFYVKLSQNRLSRGAIRQGLIACCIYYACKRMRVPRTLKEIASICNLDQALVNKCEHEFKDVMKKNNITLDEGSIETTDLCSRVANRLNLERKDEARLIKMAKDICLKIEELNIMNGKTPSAIVPTVMFFCCSHLKYKITKKQIIDLGSVSSVTLGKLLNILNEYKNELLVEHQ